MPCKLQAATWPRCKKQDGPWGMARGPWPCGAAMPMDEMERAWCALPICHCRPFDVCVGRCASPTRRGTRGGHGAPWSRRLPGDTACALPGRTSTTFRATKLGDGADFSHWTW
eukprot:1434076-Prymnesium_polylepis.1